MQDYVILGIDPGTNIMGYGVVQVIDKKLDLLSMGIIDLKKYDNHALKLKRIFERVKVLIEQYKPDQMALEAPFYGKNVQSMLKLGRAQGVAMAAGLYLDVPIIEYSPRKIKQAITGNGNASKEQVAAMLSSLFNRPFELKYLDATDALGVAVCHYYQKNALPIDNKSKKQSKTGSWESFLKSNPNRIC